MPAGPFARHEDLRGLLRQLGIARAAIVGASMGGATALDVALEYPEMVSALVLVGSGLGGYQFSEAFRRYDEKEAATLERGDLDAVVERLGELRVSTLVLVGDADVPDMLAIADLLASGIPGARKAVIQGAAHLPSMEQPQEFTRLLLAFLADTAGHS